MNDDINEDVGFRVVVGDPYVREDVLGKIVILQDETLFRDGTAINVVEKLVNPYPTPQEIFKVRLKNPD